MDYEVILSLVALIALENVLGIDNDLFISICSDKLEKAGRKRVRRIGVTLAVVFRVILLFAVSLFLKSQTPLFRTDDYSFSLKSIILIAGGIFLIYISTKEIYRRMEPPRPKPKKTGTPSFIKVLLQITTINFLFSMESIITAVGVARDTWIMYVGVLTGAILMLTASVNISKFLKAHPSLKGLSFCFLFLIGFSLICEGFAIDVPKGYIYFIMVFAIIIDLILMKINGRKIRPAHD